MEREPENETYEIHNGKKEERSKKVADYFSISSHARTAILPLLRLPRSLSLSYTLAIQRFICVWPNK